MDTLLRIAVLMQMIANPMEKFWAGFGVSWYFSMTLSGFGTALSVPLISVQKKCGGPKPAADTTIMPV
jgi:hypothetical protein